VASRLSQDAPPPSTQKRGRRATDNNLRDAVIAGWLIPPLLSKGFMATRNKATKDAERAECACSIISQALKGIGIILSEKRIAEIWEEWRFKGSD
jgi:hypothetical protein